MIDLPRGEQEPAVVRAPGFEKLYPNYNPNVTLDEVKREHILGALHYFRGGKIAASRALGITVKSLYNIIDRNDHLPAFAPYLPRPLGGE